MPQVDVGVTDRVIAVGNAKDFATCKGFEKLVGTLGCCKGMVADY